MFSGIHSTIFRATSFTGWWEHHAGCVAQVGSSPLRFTGWWTLHVALGLLPQAAPKGFRMTLGPAHEGHTQTFFSGAFGAGTYPNLSFLAPPVFSGISLRFIWTDLLWRYTGISGPTTAAYLGRSPHSPMARLSLASMACCYAGTKYFSGLRCFPLLPGSVRRDGREQSTNVSGQHPGRGRWSAVSGEQEAEGRARRDGSVAGDRRTPGRLYWRRAVLLAPPATLSSPLPPLFPGSCTS